MYSLLWKRLFIAALALATAITSVAADATGKRFQQRLFTDAEGVKHTFVVFVPLAYQRGTPTPVMLFLHGAGERGDNNIDQLMTGIGPVVWEKRATFPFVVVMPQCRVGSGWLVDGPDAQRALGMLRQIQAEFETDPDRVVLTGLSMGGSGSWSIAAKDPSAWSAVVPMCGRGDPAMAAKLSAARLPIWNFCGDQDRPETVKANRDMHAALEAAKADAKYTEYPGVPHNCWDKTYGTAEVFTWMLAQSRSKNRAVAR